jgi:hypothetical protein
MSYLKMLLAAFAATAAMTAFMLLAPVVGLPKMDVGALLGAMFGGNEAVGWIMHVIIGVLMLLPYVFFFNQWLPVENRVARGAIYGIFVFVFSEIIFTIINLTGHLPDMAKQDMARMVFGNAIAGMIYGCVLGAFFERQGVDSMERAKFTTPSSTTTTHRATPSTTHR